MAAVRAKVGPRLPGHFPRLLHRSGARAGSRPRRSPPRRKAVEAAGADIINQGIGWHEARVPTIAQKVPRAAWAFAARRLKEAVKIPVIALEPHQHAGGGRGDPGRAAMPISCRWRGRCWPTPSSPTRRARAAPTRSTSASPATRRASISSSRKRVATCLVNPKAGREIEFDVRAAGGEASASRWWARGRRASPARSRRPSAAIAVTLYEAEARIGGQLNLARNVPGKEEFDETLRYYRRASSRLGIELQARRAPGCAARWRRAASTRSSSRPAWRRARRDIPGIDHANCASYVEILDGESRGRAPCGHHRRGRHRLRRRGVPDLGAAGGRGDERRTSGPSGASMPPSAAAVGRSPPPLWGRDRVGGTRHGGSPPTPSPSPQGGGDTAGRARS